MSDSWWVDKGDLDEDQQQVVGLPDGGNYLVLGPPGSGKTNLLLLRAAYLSRLKRPNYVVLMFTKALRGFVARGASNYGVSGGKLMTIMKWAQDLLREHGVPLSDLPEKFEDRRTALTQRLHSLLDQKPALQETYECILVDEVQDCLVEEIDLFFRIARNVFFVGDRRQTIYRNSDTIEHIVKQGVVMKELRYHYRNGREVCHVADEIGRTIGENRLFPTCNYDEKKYPSSAEFEGFDDEALQTQAIVSRLKSQIKAYPGELLGVACPRKEEAKQIRQALLASELGAYVMDEEDLNPEDSNRCVYVCTMHSAKGLEFRALHLVFMQYISRLGAAQKRIAFMGVTRAPIRLSAQ